VVGNGAYQNVPELLNPSPMMFLSYWEKIGFSVTRLTDNTFQQLHDEPTKFAQEARNAEITIVYYAAMG
jgi:uncharacterized caspase-like protein